MKKRHVRLLALLICAVMLCSLVPAKANAVALQGKKMPQMQTITYNEKWQMHIITEFADLQHMAAVAANDPENYYTVSFEEYDVFTISQSIELPENLFVQLGDVLIPAGVTVVINGSGYFTSLDIRGTLEIGEYGHISANDLVDVVGSLKLKGTLYMSCYCSMSGENRVSYQGGTIIKELLFKNVDELWQIADLGRAETRPWKYIAAPETNAIHLSSPLELPENVQLQIFYTGMQFSGEQLTLRGGLQIETAGTTKFANDVVLYGDVFLNEIYDYDVEKNQIIFGGKVINNSYVSVDTSVVFEGAVTNSESIDIWYNTKGNVTFKQPQAYVDQVGDVMGMIWVNSDAGSFPSAALNGMSPSDFQYFKYYEEDVWMPCWSLSGYKKGGEPSVHQHTPVLDPAVAPDCLNYGYTEGSHCATCGEVLIEQKTLAPLGHFYGLNEKGDSDCWNPECLTCGALRVINPDHLTASMYRMYNPNTGEHFYTGSLEECQTLEAAGWQYEGVGFTICANTGDPVYRMYDPDSGEHLYTMDTEEVAVLVAVGWINEGIAFNSCPIEEVPQYRLFNPNATIGAYHFTASVEERDFLISLGWRDQGIGFYSCWQ